VGAVITPGTLLAFAAASLALIVVPGPSVAYILTATLRHGRGVGLASTLGIETGYLVHVAGTVLGVSALIAASATAFTALKVLGAGYLLWLAVRAWRSRSTGTLAELGVVPGPALSRRTAFLRGLPIGALNPKTAIFYLAFLPQFVHSGAGPAWLQLVVLGLCFIVLATAVDSLWAVFGGGLRRVLPGLRMRVLDRVSGVTMAVLALAALRASRRAVS
jgi:threonine/homoserine/homoserine lactone efflux protein